MTRDLSLGEVQALCVKATRGAGRAVGVAEDAGRAVRWLCARDIDGAGALAALLQATDGALARDMIPALPAFTPAHQAMCPLALGAYLSDMGVIPEGRIGPVWAPDLLLPFLADVSGAGVDIKGEGGTWPVSVRLIPRDGPRAVTRTRADVAGDVMGCLEAFAARTYAPATEQSRARGAGSGLSDND